MEYNFLKAPTMTEQAQGGTEMMLKGLKERIDPNLFNKFQIICSRVREVREDKIPILWLHDTFDDPESLHLGDAQSRARFKKFVFVSHWQFQTYYQAYGIPYKDSVVLHNAIDPFGDLNKPKNKINLIYHTTPHRGLELLLPAFDHVSKIVDKEVHLDVFSSFKAYGWGHRDEPYKPLFKFCEDHPAITYHGFQPNDIVREKLRDAHIFAYPSMWPETSCIAAIEALSAGCAIVSSDLAALPETLNKFGFMYRFTESREQHVNDFASALYKVIKDFDKPEIQSHLAYQKRWSDKYYAWESRIPLWNNLLSDLANGVG